MFALATSWENHDTEDHPRALPERLGRVMRHTGAAITITTVTNVLAFATGLLSHTFFIRSDESGQGAFACAVVLAHDGKL